MWSLGSLWLIINSVDDSKWLDDEDIKELKSMTKDKTKTKYLV